MMPLALIVIFLSLGFCGGNSSDVYLRELATFRNNKHDFFKNSKGSPFVQKGIEYKGASYFGGNTKYKVNARLNRLSKREILTLSNSNGTNANYLKFAMTNFKLAGQEHTLLLLKTPGFGNQYLMAFADQTSGITTYGGGRYLDLIIGKSDRIEIDFNKAYNPYCAYSPEFLCPLPPRENILSVAIEAGEKTYDY